MYRLVENDPNFIIEGVAPLSPAMMPVVQPKDVTSVMIDKDFAGSSPSAVFLILEHEPPALVAQVLAARPWSWREGMLALCSPGRRAAIAAAPVENAPVLLDYVLRSLAGRLA
jgi:hypothetical protein